MSENKTPEEIMDEVKKSAEAAADAVKKDVAEAVDAVKENAAEPIESIEKTVEDLKKKIQDLSKEPGEPKQGIDLKLSEENMEKIETIKNNTINSVNETISQVKKTAAEFTNRDEVRKTVDYLKANAVKAIDTARSKINEIVENPEVKKTLDTAGEKVKEFGEKSSKTIEGLLSEEQKDSIRKGLEQAGETVKETYEKTSKAINDYVSKPEVQETIEKTKAGAKDLADKGAELFKDLFDKKEEN